MQRGIIFVTVCLFSILVGSDAQAIDLSSLLTQNGVIKFSANKVNYNDATGVYVAEGNVRIAKGDAVVSANRIMFNSKTYDISAQGNVHWTVGKEVIRADKLEMNLSSQTGVIHNGYISVENGSYTISGKVVRKLSNVHFIIVDGKLTTCKCDLTKPAWDISASYIDATLGEYATIKDAFFKVKDIPILYVPWARVPVKTNRTSGLLVPTYTYSGINGFTISLPYFWAISQDKDATFTFDAMTGRGLGVGGDFRYANTIKDSGEFGARYFKELFLPYKRDRYYLYAHYYQDIVGGVFSKGLLNYYSDRQYLNDFDILLELASVEYVESKFTLQKNFDDADALASLIYLEDMWAPNNDNTLQQLPFGSISYFPVRILPKVPLYAECNTNVENFERSNPALPKGQRYELLPGLYLPFTIGDYVYFNSEAQYRAYLYNAGTYGIYKPGSILSAHLSAQVSTKLSKVFKIKAAALRAVKHIAVPFVSITADHIMKDDEPNIFDEVESSPRDERYITVGIRNSFIGKVKPYENKVSYPVIGRLDLSSGYDFIEAARPLTGPTDRRKPFLPLQLNLVLQPPNFLNTNIEMLVDPATLSLTQTTVIESANDLRGDNVALGYSYLRGVVSGIDAVVNLAVTPHVSLYGSANYSFYNRTLIQGVYGIRFGTSANCWNIDASYIQRPLTPSLSTVSVYLTLTGLGTIGR